MYLKYKLIQDQLNISTKFVAHIFLKYNFMIKLLQYHLMCHYHKMDKILKNILTENHMVYIQLITNEYQFQFIFRFQANKTNELGSILVILLFEKSISLRSENKKFFYFQFQSFGFHEKIEISDLLTLQIPVLYPQFLNLIDFRSNSSYLNTNQTIFF